MAGGRKVRYLATMLFTAKIFGKVKTETGGRRSTVIRRVKFL